MTTPADPLDLGPIRARLDAITPGQWYSDSGPYDSSERVYVGDGDVLLAECEKKFNPNYFNDGQFIAHAPADVSALVAEVEALRAELARRSLRTYAEIMTGKVNSTTANATSIEFDGGSSDAERAETPDGAETKGEGA